jgi:hypothetical protein
MVLMLVPLAAKQWQTWSHGNLEALFDAAW